jgi:hypothetical protein
MSLISMDQYLSCRIKKHFKRFGVTIGHNVKGCYLELIQVKSTLAAGAFLEPLPAGVLRVRRWTTVVSTLEERFCVSVLYLCK